MITEYHLCARLPTPKSQQGLDGQGRTLYPQAYTCIGNSQKVGGNANLPPMISYRMKVATNTSTLQHELMSAYYCGPVTSPKR